LAVGVSYHFVYQNITFYKKRGSLEATAETVSYFRGICSGIRNYVTVEIVRQKLEILLNLQCQYLLSFHSAICSVLTLDRGSLIAI